MVGALAAVAVAVIVTLGFFYAQAPRATPVGPGDPLPAVELPFGVTDGRVSLDGVRGGPLVLLVFLETESPGGLRFAQSLEMLHRKFRSRGVHTVGIALDGNRAHLQRVLRQRAFTYQVLHDPGGTAVARAFGPPQPHDTYLLKDGRVVEVFITAEDWATGRIAATLDELAPHRR